MQQLVFSACPGRVQQPVAGVFWLSEGAGLGHPRFAAAATSGTATPPPSRTVPCCDSVTASEPPQDGLNATRPETLNKADRAAQGQGPVQERDGTGRDRGGGPLVHTHHRPHRQCRPCRVVGQAASDDRPLPFVWRAHHLASITWPRRRRSAAKPARPASAATGARAGRRQHRQKQCQPSKCLIRQRNEPQRHCRVFRPIAFRRCQTSDSGQLAGAAPVWATVARRAPGLPPVACRARFGDCAARHLARPGLGGEQNVSAG